MEVGLGRETRLGAKRVDMFTTAAREVVTRGTPQTLYYVCGPDSVQKFFL